MLIPMLAIALCGTANADPVIPKDQMETAVTNANYWLMTGEGLDPAGLQKSSCAEMTALRAVLLARHGVSSGDADLDLVTRDLGIMSAHVSDLEISEWSMMVHGFIGAHRSCGIMPYTEMTQPAYFAKM
ncbi:hypothetical protein HOI18_00460 [Candidatus Uhrbacteria bacterium]|jgi:hypothetical protein|nr:hypothetical protein [Candidatus Uhrbacteria bacterium]